MGIEEFFFTLSPKLTFLQFVFLLYPIVSPLFSPLWRVEEERKLNERREQGRPSGHTRKKVYQ